MLDNLLVCIGAQKAGTSWLHSILSKDPRFARASKEFENVKEIHYFDYLYDNKANHINSWRAYYLIEMILKRGQSMQPVIGDYLHHEFENSFQKYANAGNFFPVKRFHKLTAELNDAWYESMLECQEGEEFSLDITPDYSVIGTEGFSHMKQVSDNLKLVFILRNPVERAWSGVLQDKKGRPGGVKAFLEQDDIDLDQIYKECTEGLNIGARTNYKKTIEAVHAAGLQDELLVLFYDDISEHPEEFIDTIYDFIGMDNSTLKTDEYVADLSKKVYATEGKKSIPAELEQRLKAYYKDMLMELKYKYNLEFPESWLHYYQMV